MTELQALMERQYVEMICRFDIDNPLHVGSRILALEMQESKTARENALLDMLRQREEELNAEALLAFEEFKKILVNKKANKPKGEMENER